MIIAKAIKPTKLQEKWFRLELLNELRKAGRAIKKDFEETTKTWKHKPKFEMAISLRQPGPTLLVDTDDEIYRYVTEGTPEHVILPKGDYPLRFASQFVPKTRPGVIGSGPGFTGERDVVSWGVIHPGTKPRKFHEAIHKKWKKRFPGRMEAAMRRAAARSGHGR